MSNSDKPTSPWAYKPEYQHQEIGLTKLEYFSGLAMQSLIMNGKTEYREVAVEAIKIAKDLLLEIKYKDEEDDQS